MEKTWTDAEMKELLEELGFDLTNEQGEYSSLVLAECAVNEGFKWDDQRDVWCKLVH